MSVQRALLLLSAQKRLFGAAYCQFLRGYCFYAKKPYRPKPVSLSQQSVLLPGKERIRSSALLEDPNKLVADIPGSPEVQTVYDCLRHGQEVSNDGHCIGSKNPVSGQYEWLRYSEVISRTQAIGSGLIQLGIKPQNDSFVGIFSVNQEEFLLTLYTCAAFSMVIVPLYLTLGLESVLYVINQASLPLIIVNNEENALKVLRNIRELPALRHLVMIDPITPEIENLAKEGNIKLLQFSALVELGRNNPHDLVLPKPDDLFAIPYTSGTTGVPKGVMLTHRNMIACVGSLVIAYGEAGAFGGTIMSYLPPAHIYEICNEVVSLYFARRIAFYSGDVKKLMDEVRILKPEILPLVPRIMNALYTRVKESVEDSVLKSFLMKTALSRKKRLLKRGKVTNQTIWDKLVLKKFQEALGGNVHMIITTSAAISTEVINFFRSGSGAYVFETYGQTETLASTMTLPLEYEGGHTGGPLPCTFIKLEDVPEMGYFSKDDFGEVCMKGDSVYMGYFKNENVTKESLIDGWQHSGDIGRWLPNGTLKIVDRRKHLFKLSQGEYIAPEKVESIYSQSKLVAQLFVDGHSDQNYVIALVLPEPTALKGWLRSKGYSESEDINQLLSKREVRKDFLLDLRKIGEEKDLNHLEQTMHGRREISELLEGIPYYMKQQNTNWVEEAKNLAFLSEPLSVENDLMSPTFKVRRAHARKHFESLFNDLYKEGPLV